MAKQKQSEASSRIESVVPQAAIPGGQLQIRGTALSGQTRARVKIGNVAAPLVVGSESFLIVRVPEQAIHGDIAVENGSGASVVATCDLGVQIADGVHPVANPAVDDRGNVFVTFSGSRGQKTPVSVYRVDSHHSLKPFIAEIMNATGLAFDREGLLYISSRFDGIVYACTPSGQLSVYVEGMGVATGIAFDRDDNLYVGDRSGTIFKISPDRQIFVFATVESSISAFHLTFGPDRHLYVTGPTTSSFDCVYRINPAGEVSLFYRGLGRPQGMAFDAAGNLYVCASLGGQRGIVRFNRDAEPELFLSGPNIVGVAFTPARTIIVATGNALYQVDAGIAGLPMP